MGPEEGNTEQSLPYPPVRASNIKDRRATSGCEINYKNFFSAIFYNFLTKVHNCLFSILNQRKHLCNKIAYKKCFKIIMYVIRSSWKILGPKINIYL